MPPSTVQMFRQAIGFVFALALVMGSGTNGACSVWSVAGINHDHHRGQEATVVFEEEGECGQPSVPCKDANDESPDLRFSLPAPVHKSFTTQLTWVLPVPATKFDASLPEVEFEALLFYPAARPPSASLQLVLCRLLI